MNRIALMPAALCVASVSFASGDFNIGPFFKPLSSPENVDAFRHGHPGLITPALNKADEFIVFRFLSGLTLDDTDALTPAPGPGNTTDYYDSHGAGVPAWNAARASVFSGLNSFVAPLAPIAFDTYRARRSPKKYVSYENCLRDAFETAARTLKDRQQRYTSRSVFRDWVHAQDQVFANCSSDTPVYPAEPTSDFPQLERADRMYQIAAAHFYAEDLETARELFSAISQDQNSPWHKIAAYMVARTLLREVSLEKNGASESAAAEAFQKIADDPGAGSLRNSARGLLQRANTTEALQSLSRRMMLPRPDISLTETLGESRYVMLTENFQKALSRADVPEPFDWVQTLESGAAGHAVDRWRAAKSLPWLTLALMFSSGKDAVSAELIKEADRLDKASPAFATAAYNAIRLRIERGERAGPRAQLDSLLANETNQPKSVLNAWRAERMRLATSFDDLLRWAPRTPIYGYKDPNSDSPVLANDSAWVLNFLTPVSKLAEAAHSAHLPEWSAADVAMAAWTRAYMLGDHAGLRDMAAILARSHPGWAAALTPPSTAQFELWKFHAAVLIAHNAAFQPLIPVDYRNHVQSNSWWCAVPLPPNTNRQNIGESDAAWRLPAFYEPGDAVIPKNDRSVADQEIARLRQIGSAQALIAPIILEWAKSHPQDPAVPEALHRIVMVVRYGCREEPANGELSKSAFDLLHSRYSKSEWAAKTPYWFK